MKLTFIVTVEVDDAQFAKVNEGRTHMGQQLHTPVDFCEDIIVDALKSPIIPDAKVRELKIATRSNFRSSGDVHATA